MRPSLLVTGLPRSGTSWVGKMIEAGGDTVYVNEPMNPSHPPGRCPGVLDAEVRHYFQYVCAENEQGWATAFADLLSLRFRPVAELRANRRPYDLAKAARTATMFAAGRRRGRRALLDDPYALFAAPWLAERFDLRAVVLVREPVSLIAAWNALGWTVNSRELLDQPLLMRHHLEACRDELDSVADSADSLAATAALWNAAYTMVAGSPDLGDRLCLVRYEDLVRDPVPTFRDLYRRLEVDWNDAAEERITLATSGREAAGGKRFRWTVRGGVSKTAYRPMDSAASLASYRDRLSPEQIDRAAALTAKVREHFYGD